jgi:two-component system nitrate/nitrite sensor histidine kinase NarX
VTAPLRAWLAVPLPFNNLLDAQRGLLLLGSSRSAVLQSGRVALVQAVSEHLAMLLQSADQMAEMEYKVMMEERTRLAREIHDGLAQTLGFLKLQMAQMLNVLERPASLDVERLRKLAHSSYAALAAAYTDARQAIDGLRITPGPYDQRADGYRLETWLRQTVAEYSEQAFVVHLDELDVPEILPPEVHAQLIRIVQEALSNIRKHAQAAQVWISCLQRDRDVILEVRDDGQGFTPDDIPQLSRYGLRGMRERAELLGADFQIISRPGQGATVRLRLPLQPEASFSAPDTQISRKGEQGEEV